MSVFPTFPNCFSWQQKENGGAQSDNHQVEFVNQMPCPRRSFFAHIVANTIDLYRL